MKVLLINPPVEYDGKRREEAFFPIGLGYIAASILEEKYEIEILDVNVSDITNDEVLIFIKNCGCDVVGITAMSTQYKYIKWISAEIKKINRNIKIILGGILATYSSEIVLKNTHIDICVISEGEITIKKILSNLDNLHLVNGIIYKNDNNEILISSQQEYIKNLDLIPMIPYDIFPTERYINSISKISICHNERTINISCGRGCPYHCTFCSKSFTGIRMRTIPSIIEEIELLKLKFGIKRIFFTDELLIINKKRINELCELIKPLNINWSCQGRINLVDEEILRKMKDSGCTAIGYGVESGSQKILDSMKKQIDIKKAVEVINITKKIGIYPILQFIYGYPGEDIKTIKETIQFFNKINEAFVSFSPITPLPGTELWSYAIEKKYIIDEINYLERLEGGYMSDSEVLINFTSFTKEEYDNIRFWAESRIRLNYFLRHPFTTFTTVIKKIRDIGLTGVLKKTIYYIKPLIFKFN